MSKFDEIREEIRSRKESIGTIGAGAYEGVSSVIPSILSSRSNPFEKDVEDYKEPETLEDFIAEAEEIARETKLRNEEGRVLSEEESAALLDDVENSDSKSSRSSKRSKRSRKKRGTSKRSRVSLSGNKNLSKEELERLNNGGGYIKKLNIVIKSNEGSILESSFRTIETGLVSLAKINTAGFSALASQVASHQQIVSFGASMRAYTMQQIIKASHNLALAKSKESLFSLQNNTTVDSFIHSNLATSFYLEKLMDMYKEGEGDMGHLKNLIQKSGKTLLQMGLRKGLEAVDKNDILGEVNTTFKNLPSLLLGAAEEGTFDEVKDRYLGKLYNVPLIGKYLEKTEIDSLIKDKIFGGMSLKDSLDPAKANRLDRSTPVGFDAQTHNGLNVVIPGYLGEIYRVLTGVSLVHDYRSGTWRTKEELLDDLVEQGKDRLFDRNSRLTEAFYSLDIEDEDKKAILYDIVEMGLDTPDKLNALKEKYSNYIPQIQEFQNSVNEKFLRTEVRLGRMVLRQEKEAVIKGSNSSNIFSMGGISKVLGVTEDESTAERALPTSGLDSISEKSLDILNLLRERSRYRSRGGDISKNGEESSPVSEIIEQFGDGDLKDKLDDFLGMGDKSTSTTVKSPIKDVTPVNDNPLLDMTVDALTPETSTASVGGRALTTTSKTPTVIDGVGQTIETMDVVDDITDVVEKN